MAKYCPICDAYTNCTESCTSCLEEEEKKEVIKNVKNESV